ncbi:MAG: hypothetical protein ACJ70X_04405, partial [Nitrososphaera sp.]
FCCSRCNGSHEAERELIVPNGSIRLYCKRRRREYYEQSKSGARQNFLQLLNFIAKKKESNRQHMDNKNNKKSISSLLFSMQLS